MIDVSLQWVAEQISAQIVGIDVSRAKKINVCSVSTDSRSVKEGNLFLALQGPNFDGHEYVVSAIQKGAIAAVVNEDFLRSSYAASDLLTNFPLLLVEDPKLALGHLASAVRQKVQPKTIGITGSSGKTTVKEMVSSILRERGKVLSTKGNFNNDIGVPLTLLDLSSDDEYAVIEMGANHQGEIEYTHSLVKPDVSTIINASPAHIEGFGSLFGVARAKSEIVKDLPSDSTAILNRDSQFFEFWEQKSSTNQVLTFSFETQNGDFHAEKVSINSQGCAEFVLVTPIGKVAIRLRVPGSHNVSNAIVSAALAISVGANLANVKEGLFKMRSVGGRLAVKELGKNLKVIDDTYNANVGSVKAALDLLSNFKGFKLFVFGDMGELGDQAAFYHEQIGDYAKQKQIDFIISSGKLSVHTSAVLDDCGIACDDTSSAAEATIRLVSERISKTHEPITILVKGSRSAKMEEVVAALSNFNFHNESKLEES